MNRREFLSAIGTSANVTLLYDSATSDRDTDADDLPISEKITYVVDDYADETGRVFRLYDVTHFSDQWTKWAIDTADGERIYQDSFRSDQTKIYSYSKTLQIKFWLDGEYQGDAYILLDADYAYHSHNRDDEDVQYRVHIKTDEHERIQ